MFDISSLTCSLFYTVKDLCDVLLSVWTKGTVFQYITQIALAFCFAVYNFFTELWLKKNKSLTPRLPSATHKPFKDIVDLDQTAQNMQSDLKHTLSQMAV